MIEPTPRAWITIDLRALKKNLSQVRAHCPEAKIIPVIKANGYGHGMQQVAQALKDSRIKLAAFAVASIEEALQLHAFNLDISILLLSGFVNEEELVECMEVGIEPVIHSHYQVSLLQKIFAQNRFDGTRKLWIKQNTGMNRLGFSAGACIDAYRSLHKYPHTALVLMSHLAYADDINDPASHDYTEKQLAQFDDVRKQLLQLRGEEVESSMAASAGILTLPKTHYQYVRPGVMLYGSSPLALETGEELGLLPVMTLYSRLIAINLVKAGEFIGYNAGYSCDRDTRVGVVSIGYADGYPRSAPNGTPVIVNSGAGPMRSKLIGRVSMDMLTVDLTDMDQVQIGDEVVLWGSGLGADEVARLAGTISYELFCKVTQRVKFEYV